jgi:DNA-binding LytR/AlgR family response regulator
MMEPIRTLLVDDEYLALQLLENFVNQTPDLLLVDKVKLPLKALDILHEQPVDLLFLDIQMPLLSGSALLKTLQNPPLVVFTTAYNEYAVEAFNLNVVDYLLKPFSFDRFLQAVQKAKETLRARQRGATTSQIDNEASDFLVVKADGKMTKIFFEELLYVEGLKEYVRFVCTQNRKYVVLESLKKLENNLPAHLFLRVHKSYIVAVRQVSALEGNQLEIGHQKIPISREKREEVVAQIFGKL